MTLPPVLSTSLTHMETCSCVEQSVSSSRIKPKSSGYLHALAIWGCAFYPRIMYLSYLEDTIVFRRVWSHEAKLAWNYLS